MGKVGLIKCHPISQTPRTRWCWRRHFGGSDHIEAKLHLSSLFRLFDPPHTALLAPGMMAAFLFLQCSSLPAPQGTGVRVGWEPGTGFQGDRTGLFRPTNLWECSSRVDPEWDEAREKKEVYVFNIWTFCPVWAFMSVLTCKNKALKYDVSDSWVYWLYLNLDCRSAVHSPHPEILQKRMQEGDNKENLCSESQLLGEKPPEARRNKSQFCRDCRGSRTGGSKVKL